MTVSSPSPHPAVSRREQGVVWALTGAFLAVLVMWTVLTPIYGAPDEPAHLNSAIRLTEGLSWPAPGQARLSGMVVAAREEAALPAQDRHTFAELALTHPADGGVDQMTQHPPLYYAFGAVVLRTIGFPDLRADLALLAVRLAGLVFAAPLPLLAWASVRRLTRSPKAAVVGAAALLLVPQLAQILGAVSNDGLVVLACSTAAWLTIRVLTGDARWPVVVGAGLALGVALLTKGTALPFVPFVGVALAVWPRGLAPRRRLARAATALGAAFVVGGWWWVRNLLVFHDLQPSGLAPGRDTVPWKPGTGPDIVSYLDLMWSRISVSFWGDFGWLDYALPQLLTDVLTVVCILVIVVWGLRRGPLRGRMVLLAALPALLFVMLVANTWRHFVRTQAAAGMQGRYFYVTIVVLIVLSAVAWRRMVPPASRSAVGIAVISTSAGVALLGLFREYIGVYELSQYRVSLTGFRIWVQHTPAGLVGVVSAAVLLAALGALALVLAIRLVRAEPPVLSPELAQSPGQG